MQQKPTKSEQILDLAAQLPIDKLPDLLREIANLYCEHQLEVFILGRGTASMYMHNLLRVLFEMKPASRSAQCIAFSSAAMMMAAETIEGRHDEGHIADPKLQQRLAAIHQLNQDLARIVDPAHL